MASITILGDGEPRPVPDGWIKLLDSKSNAWYYVETTRRPPRSTWVHPHDDPLFLRAHPQYKMEDELRQPEKKGLFSKLKTTKREKEERAAMEKEHQEWKGRLALLKVHAEKYGDPPQYDPPTSPAESDHTFAPEKKRTLDTGGSQSEAAGGASHGGGVSTATGIAAGGIAGGESGDSNIAADSGGGAAASSGGGDGAE